MMGYQQSIFLGILQGLTEFLPVSSSGHLVILQVFMGLTDSGVMVTFDIFLHMATLLAVVWVYRADLKNVLTGKAVGDGNEKIPGMKLTGFIFVSLLATGVILPFKDSIEGLFETLNGVRVLLLINAAALAVLPTLRKGGKTIGSIGWIGAVAIGLAQACGAFPGISRSGSTIIAGLLLGLSPKEACRYSFLLSIPTILVAAVVQIPDAIKSGFVFVPGPMTLGFILSLLSGLIAIPLLIGIVEKGKLWGFSIYCAAVGLGLFFVPH